MGIEFKINADNPKDNFGLDINYQATEENIQKINETILKLDELIKERFFDDLFTNLDEFKSLGNEYIVDKLINADSFYTIDNDNLKKIDFFTKDTAIKLIKRNELHYVIDRINLFPINQAEIIEILTTEKKWSALTHIICNFPNLNLSSNLAIELVASGYLRDVVRNLKQFPKLNQLDIIDTAISLNMESELCRNIDYFTNHQAVADRLIAADKTSALFYDLDSFKNVILDKELADQMIEEEKWNLLASNLNKFKNINYQELAEKFIEGGRIEEILDNLDKFSNLNHRIAEKLINSKRIYRLFDNLDKFTDINEQEIAEKLISAGEGALVANNIEKFNKIDFQIISNKLIAAGKSYSIIRNINKFPGKLNKQIAIDFINTQVDNNSNDALINSCLDCLFKYEYKFDNLNIREIFDILITKQNSYGILTCLSRYSELFSKSDLQNAANMLIEDESAYRKFASYLKKFTGLDKNIANKLIDKNEAWSVASNIKSFYGLDQAIALKLIEADQTSKVISNLDLFINTDNQEIADILIKKNNIVKIVHNLEKFPKINHVDLAKDLIRGGNVNLLVGCLEKFSGINHNSLAEYLISKNELLILTTNLNKFSGLTINNASTLIDSGYCKSVLENIKSFEGLDITFFRNKYIAAFNNADIKTVDALSLLSGYGVLDGLEDSEDFQDAKMNGFKKAMKNSDFILSETIINCFAYDEKKLTDSLKEIIDNLLKKEQYCAADIDFVDRWSNKLTEQNVIDFKKRILLECQQYELIREDNNIDFFEDVIKKNKMLGVAILKDFLKPENFTFQLATKLNNLYGEPLDKALFKTEELLGDYADYGSYDIIKKIYDNHPETVKEMNLKKGGSDGIKQLGEKIISFKSNLLKEDFDPEILLPENTNKIITQLFKHYTRFTESTWGDHDDDSCAIIIYNFLNYKEVIQPLNPNFTPSGDLYIEKSNEEARKKYVFNEHFLKRFDVLLNSLKSAKKLSMEKFPYSELIRQIETKRQTILLELNQKSEQMPNPLAKKTIDEKIKNLESINIRDLNDFQKNFNILAKEKSFNELLRITVFLISLNKNKQSLQYDLNKIDKEKPTVDDISWILNFIDHITNQEVMRQYFNDDHAIKSLNEITSTLAIKEELAILQNQGNDFVNTTKIDLTPTRGILTEFSGHIADACWASKYESILHNYPNFTSVIIRQNPNSKHDRLAGSFMLIETTSEKNEPLLIIRGLNPIENLINSVSVDSFYKKITEFVTDLAKKAGRQAAIVIDEHSGGAATNRPVLFDYLSKLKLEKVNLGSNTESKFNNYDINDCTWLLPKINE